MLHTYNNPPERLIVFNAIKATKLIVSSIVGLGVGKVIGQVIKNNTSPENVVDKVTMLAASWTIAGIVSNASKEYTDKTVDDVVEMANKAKAYFAMQEKLGRINRDESTFEKEGLDPNLFERSKKTGKWVPIKIEDAVIVDEN